MKEAGLELSQGSITVLKMASYKDAKVKITIYRE